MSNIEETLALLNGKIDELETLVFEAFETMAAAAARHDDKADKGWEPHSFHKQRAARLNYWLDRAGPVYNQRKRRAEAVMPPRHQHAMGECDFCEQWYHERGMTTGHER